MIPYSVGILFLNNSNVCRRDEMTIQYLCRHCGTSIGQIPKTKVTEQQLGLHILTAEEREHIISYDLEGNMSLKVTCDYCQQMLSQNPELLLLPGYLQ